MQSQARAYNESELRVDIPPDRRIQLGSAEVGDRNRGIYSDGIVLDEPAQMSTYFVTSVIRPALSDRAGSLLAIGTPQARFGAFFDLWELSATEPDWWRGKYTVEDTQLINAAELRSAKRLMGNNAYLSEYMCVWGVSVRGAFYAEVMEAIDKAGQIGRVRHAEQHLVHTCWDLGVTDSTAIFAFQAVGGEYNFLKHWEFTNRSYADIVGVLKDYATEQRWQYGKAIVPHDAKNKSQITGHSRRRTLEKLGLNTVVAPNRGIMDGIDLLRSRLRNCNFDSEGCRLGLEALRQYQSEWVDEKGVMKTQPLHNWASHSADSMRYFAVTPNSRLTSKTGRDKEYAADYY